MGLPKEHEPSATRTSGPPELRVLPGGSPAGARDWRAHLWAGLGWMAVVFAALAALGSGQDIVLLRGPAQEAAVSVASWVLFATVLQACAGFGMARGSRSNAWALRIGLGAIAGITAVEGDAFSSPVVWGLGAWIALSFVARTLPRD